MKTKICLTLAFYLCISLAALAMPGEKNASMNSKKGYSMDKIIHHSVRLNCDTHRAFEMFTENELLQSWLPKLADVEPVLGGKYEVFWKPEDKASHSTIGCKVTAIEQDKFIAFEWKGPPQFKHFMNVADPLTHVVVFFVARGNASTPKTDVHLIHSGWGSSDEWEEARQFFNMGWKQELKELSQLVQGK